MGYVCSFYTRTEDAVVANTSSPTALLISSGATGAAVVGADEADVGDMIRITCSGTVKAEDTDNPDDPFTLTFSVFCPASGSPVLLVEFTRTFGGRNFGDIYFLFTCLITVRSLQDGVNPGEIASNGTWWFSDAKSVILFPDDGPQVTEIDTTVANTINIIATFSVADPDITLAMDQCALEYLVNGDVECD